MDDGPMRVLVLGGTAFVGRAVVEAALARGWRVTTFNRGQTGEDVPGVEPIRATGTILGRAAPQRSRASDQRYASAARS